MKALEFLGRAAIAERKINTALRKVELYRSMAERITASMEGEVVSRTRNVSSGEDAIIRMVEAKETVKALTAEYQSIVDEITNMFMTLTVEYGATILFLKYLKNKSFREIGEEIYLGHSRVKMIHDDAILELDGLLKREDKSGQNWMKLDR